VQVSAILVEKQGGAGHAWKLFFDDEDECGEDFLQGMTGGEQLEHTVLAGLKIFSAAALGNVGKHSEDRGGCAVFVENGRAGDKRPEVGAILAAKTEFGVVVESLFVPIQCFPGVFLFAGIKKREGVLAQHFLRGVSEHIGHRGIDEGGAFANIQDPNSLVGAFDEAAIVPLALRQFLRLFRDGEIHLLQIRDHGVEGPGESSEFVSAVFGYALRPVAAGNKMGGGGQLRDGPGDPLRGEPGEHCYETGSGEYHQRAHGKHKMVNLSEDFRFLLEADDGPAVGKGNGVGEPPDALSVLIAVGTALTVLKHVADGREIAQIVESAGKMDVRMCKRAALLIDQAGEAGLAESSSADNVGERAEVHVESEDAFDLSVGTEDGDGLTESEPSRGAADDQFPDKRRAGEDFAEVLAIMVVAQGTGVAAGDFHAVEIKGLDEGKLGITFADVTEKDPLARGVPIA